MKNILTISALCTVLSASADVSASITSSTVNVAEGKSVTLEGAFFVPVVWGIGTGGTPESVVDGQFLPRYQWWESGTVWWDANHPASVNNYVRIDLGATYQISGIIVQADDNDIYLLEYKDAASSWQPAYLIPNINTYGMTTRPNPDNDLEQHTAFEPFETDSLRISAVAGDGMYAVSEIQAFSPVPVPAAVWLFGSGSLALVLLRGAASNNTRTKPREVQVSQETAFL